MRRNSVAWKHLVEIAEFEASKISAKYSKTGRYPVNFQQLFDLLGLRQRANAVKWLGTGGFIDLKERDPRIFYSASDNRTRIRFTIAHELGHWVVFNDEELQRFLADISNLVPDCEERFCDAFASAILMPRWEFSKSFVNYVNTRAIFLDHNTDPTTLARSEFVESLSANYGVAFEACVHRIQLLELLKGSNVLVFCARNRGKIAMGGAIKLRISMTAFDRSHYFIPKNKGLHDLGWKGQPGSDIHEFFQSDQELETLRLFYKSGKEKKLREVIASCKGDYFCYGKAHRVLVGVYTVLETR